jgi:hypothetical protein
MNMRFDFRALSITFSVALVVSYLLCIAGDLLFDWTMYTAWTPLLPGFIWPLSTSGFLVGLLWLIGYGIFGAALLAFPYNFLSRRISPSQ